jgi:hypothetical protein
VERRKEPRATVRQPATVTILNEEGGKLPAMIENRSPSGVSLRVSRAIPLSAPVRIDTGEEMLLGEVCHCSRQETGFLVGLQVEHVVRHLPALIRLNRAIEDELGEPERRQRTRS